MMSISALITIAVIIAIFIALATDRFAPEMVMLAGLATLLAAGVVSPETAFSGFANQAVITLAALYVITGSLRQTGALDAPSRRLLEGCKTVPQARRRITLVVAPLSAFLNNTPIVAAMMPVVSGWARRHGVTSRGLFLPLSYAAVLGGTCTLLGTSTHLVIHGQLVERGMPGLGVFELLPIGASILVTGLPMLWFMSRHLLGEGAVRRNTDSELGREYTTDLSVVDNSPLIGMTVEAAGLRHLPGLFLVRITRRGRTINPVGPGELLNPGDRLTFAGVLETIVDLTKRKGFKLSGTDEGASDWVLHEGVVSRGSPLIGRSIREANFRGRYGAAVVAVHRHGGRIKIKIGDIIMRHGDTVLMQASPGFARTFRDSADFYLISEVPDGARTRHGHAWVSLVILLSVIGLAATGILPLATSAVLGAVLAVATGCISTGAARRSIDTSVIMVMGAALGLAQAVEQSGLSDVVAVSIQGASASVGPLGVLIIVYMAGMVLTEIVTNVAAAALLFPVALGAATALGVDSRPFILATSISAAMSLATPLGYQTNMMVYGPGGYRFTDFLRMGLPLQLGCGAVAITTISLLYDVSF